MTTLNRNATLLEIEEVSIIHFNHTKSEIRNHIQCSASTIMSIITDQPDLLSNADHNSSYEDQTRQAACYQ